MHGPGLDNLVMIRHADWFDVDGDNDLLEKQNLFVHQDQVGSTIALTGPSGGVVERGIVRLPV